MLGDEAQARVDRAKQTRRYAAGSAVFEAGEPTRGLYCMHRGVVAVRHSDSHGNSVLVQLTHPAQTLGAAECFAGQEIEASAETLTDSVICFVDGSVVDTLVARHPPLGLAFLERMARDLKQAHEAYLRRTALTVRQRLAHLVLTLLPYCARHEPGEHQVMELPMTQQILAELLGARRETIVRAFAALQSDGLLRYENGTVIVSALERLRAEAGETG
ncbi:MAG TPA: Crp/Fnr family transcriptional regulator [bacterium]|nr:Crp/Fnr family transcriptional regulator [bacterium]